MGWIATGQLHPLPSSFVAPQASIECRPILCRVATAVEPSHLPLLLLLPSIPAPQQPHSCSPTYKRRRPLVRGGADQSPPSPPQATTPPSAAATTVNR